MQKSMIIAILVGILLTLSVSTALAHGNSYHTVSHGETLFSIGRRYGVNPYAIARANNLHNPDFIYTGQRLYIPDRDTGHNPPSSNRHVVRYGETLSSIGRAYGISAWAIAKHNNIYNLNRIYAGQVLYIPKGY